jgi:hypothetical protein
MSRISIHRNNSLAGIASAALLALSIPCSALAQDGTFPPEAPRGGRGERPMQDGAPRARPGQEGRPAGDPAQMAAQLIDRLMQADANGDGKLSAEELPPAMSERLLGRADANSDGLIERSELETAVRDGVIGARGNRGGAGAGAGGDRPGAGGAPSVGGAMRQVGRAMRGLKESAFDASSRKSDLDLVQQAQMGLVGSKSGAAALRMSESARVRFGEDRASFETAFRAQMLDAIAQSIELERALLAGNGDTARAAFAKMNAAQESGHELFQPADEGGEQPARGRGQGQGQGQGAGEGGGAGAPDAPRGRGGRGERGGRPAAPDA